MPARQQFMLWWSGLRGAMAFALAIDAAASYGEAGEVMKVR
jgi:NhaP-type Na+/H+ or K+/H+ antiporter